MISHWRREQICRAATTPFKLSNWNGLLVGPKRTSNCSYGKAVLFWGFTSSFFIFLLVLKIQKESKRNYLFRQLSIQQLSTLEGFPLPLVPLYSPALSHQIIFPPCPKTECNQQEIDTQKWHAEVLYVCFVVYQN